MTIDELEQELLRLSADDRYYLGRVLAGSMDRKEREAYFEMHIRPFIKADPLKGALVELQSTMSGLSLNARSVLIDALGHDLDAAWEKEIERRIQESERGEAEFVDLETVRAEIEARLKH